MPDAEILAGNTLTAEFMQGSEIRGERIVQSCKDYGLSKVDALRSTYSFIEIIQTGNSKSLSRDHIPVERLLQSLRLSVRQYA
jgi:hypothetical protein